jgi:threonine aldolase
VEQPQTNMVFVDVSDIDKAAFARYLGGRGILATIEPCTRLVTHLDLSRGQIEATLEAFREFPGWSA